jgi:hypothetical protein
MHDRAAHLMANVFPDAPVRQWVLSPPSELVPLLAVRPKVLSTFVQSFVDGVSAEMKARSDSSGGGGLHTGAVAFIQRFTKTLGLFPHVHVVFVDDCWFEAGRGRGEFREAAPPDDEMVFEVGSHVFTQLERFLKREGYLDPTDGDAPEALDRWWMRATQEPPVLPSRPRLVPAPGSELPGGFSIHAGVRIEGDDREGREQLLRYAARPAFSEVQLSLLEDDIVELELKSPTASGQRVVHLHPVQFLRRLGWLIPPPKQNQVRYYGVFAPTHLHAHGYRPGAALRGRERTEGLGPPDP